MPGVTQPGGRVLTADHVDQSAPHVDLCGTATVGLALPGGRVLQGRHTCGGDSFDDSFSGAFG